MNIQCEASVERINLLSQERGTLCLDGYVLRPRTFSHDKITLKCLVFSKHSQHFRQTFLREDMVHPLTDAQVGAPHPSGHPHRATGRDTAPKRSGGKMGKNPCFISGQRYI